ncbi:hypothetical protein Dsin_014366 [Dipteronia sinensis]|uniref:DUF4220 domain-containing protein n=1 Tax=Dipteronia sinensis TaxID=43782 RepID=A0AAE0ALU2_9ROSI|nr:hypothetical protein Dsin_014366 [Dipteronia sinensis]
MENGRGFLDLQPARNIENPMYYYRDSRLHIPDQIKSDEDTLLFAKHLVFISSHAFLDDTMVQSVSTCSFKMLRAMLPEYALKVIEIELGLMYDLLFTKAPLLYSRWGLVLWLITFFLT